MQGDGYEIGYNDTTKMLTSIFIWIKHHDMDKVKANKVMHNDTPFEIIHLKK